MLIKTPYISKEQGKFDFSCHDPFKRFSCVILKSPCGVNPAFNVVYVVFLIRFNTHRV